MLRLILGIVIVLWVCRTANAQSPPINMVPGLYQNSGCTIAPCWAQNSPSNPFYVTPEGGGGGSATNPTASSTLPSLSAGVQSFYESLSGGQFVQPIFGTTLVDATHGLPVLLLPGTSSVGGVQIYPDSTTSSSILPKVGSGVSNVIAKASAGNLYSAYITAGSTPVWLFAINATSIPANATLTAGNASGNFQACIPIPANTAQSLMTSSGPSMQFSTGIVIAASSTACPVLTASTSPIFVSAMAF